MQPRARLLERLQERIRGLDAEELGPREADDAPRALVGSPGSERDRLANAIDADLDALRIDGEKVGVESVKNAAARFASAPWR